MTKGDDVERWLAHGAPGSEGWLQDVIRALDPDGDVTVVLDARDLRGCLRSEEGVYSVLVAEGTSVDAINVAAAVAADGHARQVVLLCHETSGSLRSRAALAGVDRVLGEREAVVAVRATKTMTTEETAERVVHEDDPDDEGESSVDDRPREGQRHGTEAEDGREGEVSEPVPKAAVRPAGGAPIIVVVSGRGGVGKSALAATLATTAASWAMDTCLLDLDLGFGNLFGYFGLEGPVDVTPLAEAVDSEQVARLLREAAPGVDLLGPCAMPEYAELVSARTQEILAELCRTHDLVIVDGSTTWGEAMAQALQWADRVLVCADERAGAIGSLSRATALAVRLGVARTRIVRVMNRCDPRHRDEGFLARADLGLETAGGLRILEGGIEVPELLSAGHAEQIPSLENGFSSSCAQGLAQLLSELGCLPDVEAARRARDGRSQRPPGVLAFLKGAV